VVIWVLLAVLVLWTGYRRRGERLKEYEEHRKLG
jgi:hypothetical protein